MAKKLSGGHGASGCSGAAVAETRSAPRKIKTASGGLKRSRQGVNANGAHYVEILDGILYAERKQVKEFKAALKELCERFDYKFVPTDEFM